MKKKRLLTALACAALLALPTTASAESTDLTLMVNDITVCSDPAQGAAYIDDGGHTMIPLRVVSDVMGYTTDWQPGGQIHITDQESALDVTLQTGTTAYTANGQSGQFTIAPLVRDDRTYLPARDFTAFYGHIYWDSATRTVWITQDNRTTYRVIDHDLLRADGAGVEKMTLPEGFAITDTAAMIAENVPMVWARDIDRYIYVTLNNTGSFSEPIPLFRVAGDYGERLEYLTSVYGSSSYYVDKDAGIVYSTDGTGAGAWTNQIVPERLYVTALTDGATTEVMLDFAVNRCILDKEGDTLTATDIASGTVHTIDIDVAAAT